MKKVYESPVMIEEEFSADQSVAGTCAPGVREKDIIAYDVTCERNTGLFTHWHINGYTTTVFTNSNCTTKVKEGNLDPTNGNITVEWGDNNHRYTIHGGMDGNKPHYFTS